MIARDDLSSRHRVLVDCREMRHRQSTNPCRWNDHLPPQTRAENNVRCLWLDTAGIHRARTPPLEIVSLLTVY